MAKNAGMKAIAKEEKRREKERKRQVELANKMLIPSGKKTLETLGIISFDPTGVFRLTENRWIKIFSLDGDISLLACKMQSISGRIRIVKNHREDGGRATCHMTLMENGEIYEEVRHLMAKDEELIKEVVRITPLCVDEVMQSIIESFGQNIRFSYASYVRGNKDWKKECFLEIEEEATSFRVGRVYGEVFSAISYPSIISDWFIERFEKLGCETYFCLDMKSLSQEEQLDFNRALEKRYNRRISTTGGDYLNISLTLMVLCDSDDAREIIEKTVIALANSYGIMLTSSFHEQKTKAESILSFGLLDSKIMRNVQVEVLETLMGGETNADA